MAGCSAITQSGARCNGVAVRGSEWCPSHHPDTQERRRAGARRGGKAKGTREIVALKDRLNSIAALVLAGKIDPRPAAVGVQALNTLLRAMELERRIREADELEGRIRAGGIAHH